MLEAVRLRCEYHESPIGIDEPNPRLSWQLRSERRGARQTAWQIRVASRLDALERGEADLWDGGKVAGDRTLHIEYAGRALQSNQLCWWSVRVWDVQDNAGPWSKPAFWTMGLLDTGDWSAAWIGGEEMHAAPLLRGCFSLAEAPLRAQLHITALGNFEAHLNGRRVGQDYFAPGWTDYRRRLLYHSYDVSNLLRQGENVLGALLAPGWYRGFISPECRNDYYGGSTALCAQLDIELPGGVWQRVISDASWRTQEGPILTAELLHGEVFDARRDPDGWDAPGFDDAAWSPVQVRKAYTGALRRHCGNPVQAIQELPALAVSEHRAGAYIFDFGQNISGWVRLKIREPRGKRLVLRFAEMLNPDGSLCTRNLRRAQAMDIYIARGAGEEIWEPRFTYHGFRYVEIEGIDTQHGDHPLYCNRPALELATAVAVSSVMPVVGHFDCSDADVNQLASNIQWGLFCNFIDIPTDCPQRDERLGWTGDVAAFIRSANYLSETAAFLSKWMDDIADAQHADGCVPNVAPDIEYFGAGVAGWGDAIVICPWELFRAYGDRRILQRHYAGMLRWMNWLEAHSHEGLRPNTGLGDWLSMGADTPRDLIATAFFGYSAGLMHKIANVLGHGQDASRFEALLGRICQAFNRKFVDAQSGRIAGDTQTGYLLALNMGMLAPEVAERAFARLCLNVEELGRISTGFLGVQHINPVLTRGGRSDLAWQLLLNRDCPSWLYAVKHGATTIWERWDGWTREQGYHPGHMNSFNHYAFGSIGEWLFSGVAGIDTEEPGYARIVICPRPCAQISRAEGSYDSIRGTIRCAWFLHEDALTLDVTLPAGTTGRVFVPRDSGTIVYEGESLAEKADQVELLDEQPACSIFAIGSGSYRFRSTCSDLGGPVSDLIATGPLHLNGNRANHHDAESAAAAARRK